MGIRAKHTRNSIRLTLNGQIGRLKAPIINTLCYAGEMCVNTAKSLPHPPESLWKEDGAVKSSIPPHQPNYIDWTANLRSSIGYVVADDGEIVQAGGFEPIAGGEQGASNGRRFAEDLARTYSGGYVLILVAGMRYAAYVQSKGYDVLSSATIQAEELVPQLLGQLT